MWRSQSILDRAKRTATLHLRCCHERLRGRQCRREIARRRKRLGESGAGDDVYDAALMQARDFREPALGVPFLVFSRVRPSLTEEAEGESSRLLHRNSFIRSSLQSGRRLKHAEAALLSKASGEPSAAGFPQFHRARQLLSCTALTCKWTGKRQDFQDAAETEKSGQ